MPHAREPSTISAFVARDIFARASSKGCDSNLIFARLGIASVEGETIWLLAKFTAALEAAALDRRDTLLGLKLGRSQRLIGMGSVGTLMRTCRNAADAFSKFAKYFPQTNTRYVFGIEDDLARISYLITDPTITRYRQDAELTISQQQALLSELLGSNITPTRIHFRHTPHSGASASDYRSQFSCEMRFGQNENAIYFPSKALIEPQPQADECVKQQVETQLADAARVNRLRVDFAAAIEGWMTSGISSGRSITIENAASDFEMSLRSFQRKLNHLNVSYLDLRHNVRTNIAKCLLNQTPLSVTAIAEHLGYSEISAFSRHFKGVMGVSPARFRELAQSAQAARERQG